MQCERCGTLFEGNFCPQCGSPAAVSPGSALRQCPRCGTSYQGRFCPNCGLPADYPSWHYAALARPRTGRAALSVLWTIAIGLFIVIAGLGLVGLGLASGLVIPGILGVQPGAIANQGLDVDAANWTFTALQPSANGSHRSAGGNPGGYLEVEGSGVGAGGWIGYWTQPFDVTGSLPYLARVDLDVAASFGSAASSVDVFVIVSRTPTVTLPSPQDDSVMTFSGTTDWTRTRRYDESANVTAQGRYYLSIAVDVGASGSGSATVVGIDNVHMTWTTDAAVVLYLPVPFPAVFAVSQSVPLFLAYWGFVVAVIFAGAAYHVVAERREMSEPFRAPLESVGKRLRNRSAWWTIGQVWLAITFFQVAALLVFEAIGIPATSPIELTPGGEWALLYELASAAVYEEITFRVLLIGLPMAAASLILRGIELNRKGGVSGSTSWGRHLAGSLRYLIGGNTRRSSRREALLAALSCLVVSAAFFGLAHAPGWGWWKVVPSFVAGLGFGYLFLRHGVTAGILAHLVNNYLGAWLYLDPGGPLDALTSLLFLGAIVAGAGFFAWYMIYSWQFLKEMRRWFAGPRKAFAAQGASAAAAAPPVAAAMPYAPNPPASVPPPTERNSSLIPRDYRPTYRPPPYGYPPVRFQCPSCGWVEARYEDGRFVCVRCGRPS